MNVSMIKYLNLFNTDLTSTGALLKLLMHPPQKLEIVGNPSISTLPATQQLMPSAMPRAPRNEFQELQKLIMLFPSITFTRTMARIIEFSLKKVGMFFFFHL